MLAIILAIADEEDRLLVEQLYTTYEEKLYHIAYSILHNHHDAEDCIHDTIVKVIDYLPKYKSISDTYRSNLLFITCRNVAINIYNKKKDHNINVISITNISEDDSFSEYDIRDYSADVEKLIVDQENADLIQNLIRRLDELDRDVVVLKYFFQFRTREIADVLHLTENAVNLRLSRARKRIMEEGGEALHGIYTK